ncbi:hypothetical protein [Humidisolicoccus flavus]|uniref:hypothetical protein n=1 Tax=Humidisolicoccus flavus TaxID=3111414 RepID=UPI003247EBB7
MNLIALALPLVDRLGVDEDLVTPGVVGFAVTAMIAAAVILLVWDLNRRIRRTTYRAEIREKIAQEIVERDAALAGSRRSESAARAAGEDTADPADPAAPTREPRSQ